MTLQNTDLFLVNRGGTSHRYSYQNIANEINSAGVAEVAVADATDWTLDSPFIRFAGGTLNFPTVPVAKVNSSGLIRLTAGVLAYDNTLGNFVFPNGTAIAGTAEATLPFYVQATNRILIGFETPAFS